MPGREQFTRVLSSLASLGPRRLMLLCMIGITVFTAVGLSGMYLSQPQKEALYAGLETQDVTRIGAALNAAGIEYDISPDGKAVLVNVGQTARARMLLAEKGLPRSASAGYELFDDLGSLGLTSFMQEITKVRALEGEIGRTIQLMEGVKAARVHLVMPDPGSFRSNRQSPSASVVIRTATGDTFGSARAIRHLVAAAIPGLRLDRVTVLNTEGTLLASGDDAIAGAPRKMVDLEGTIGKEIQEKVRRTLAPFLGVDNFQISVSAQLNVDKKQIKEVMFDPDSRVERSVRVVKEAGETKNKSGQSGISVEQELPETDSESSDGGESSETRERREELTNYEVNSKTVSTETNGYVVEKLAIALVVNNKRIESLLGKNATADQVKAQMEEIRLLVASAAGFNETRGDSMKVTAVDFFETSSILAPVAGPSIASQLLKHSGSAISALTVLIATFMLIWFGLRPATKLLVEPAPLAVDPDMAVLAAPEDGAAENEAEPDAPQDTSREASVPNPPAGLAAQVESRPQQRLQQIVELDEEQAVLIMKQWAQAEAV
ncbi:MAG: flagellar M-ring protein FliF [Rhizobiales bacterium]|nr:flagellar M-ring protein FliF [Hyphomicrobiales bacterium]